MKTWMERREESARSWRSCQKAMRAWMRRWAMLVAASCCCLLLPGCSQGLGNLDTGHLQAQSGEGSVTLDEIPDYSGEAYVPLEGNEPDFSQEDLTEEPFEEYSEQDSLGRCGTAYANVGPETMPHETREPIGQIKPSGWQSVKYDSVDGKYLYNRCHLIGFQLTAENANEKNLITGTRYMNVDGMLPFENMVADYVEETSNHVLYRVTPMFEGDNLVASGVQMEAMSVEDEGEGVLYHVYVYNVQPGISIDYETGDSAPAEPDGEDAQVQADTQEGEIRGNSESKIYHCPGQAAYEEMEDSKYLVTFGTEQEAIDAGYRKAKR